MQVREFFEAGREALGRVVVGNEETVDGLLAALVLEGHVLIEGPPGTAKTLLARSLARIAGLGFARVQFTPDLMPADLTGTLVWVPGEGKFELRRGPIFASVIVADEINRTPPKTQAALLEAMEEGRVTIEGETLDLPRPFVVCATENPIEFEGTYPLPEAQLDRFLFKLLVGYPNPQEEREILRRHQSGFRARDLDQIDLPALLDPAGVLALQSEAMAVTVVRRRARVRGRAGRVAAGQPGRAGRPQPARDDRPGAGRQGDGGGEGRRLRHARRPAVAGAAGAAPPDRPVDGRRAVGPVGRRRGRSGARGGRGAALMVTRRGVIALAGVAALVVVAWPVGLAGGRSPRGTCSSWRRSRLTGWRRSRARSTSSGPSPSRCPWVVRTPCA